MMSKIDWKRKLSSRKLWAAAAGIVTGLAMVFRLDESTINSVAGAVVSVASVVAYIITEGKVDAESARQSANGKTTASKRRPRAGRRHARSKYSSRQSPSRWSSSAYSRPT
jgi:phage shock protein PspC (stress-responsive transcriptional regulator)